MAKQPARKSKTSQSSTARRRKLAAPAAGPVTLKQAQALVQARQAARASRSRAARAPASGSRARKTAVSRAAPAPTSHAVLGAERKKLGRQQQQELRRRVQEYTATLAIMKERGVKGLGPAPGTRAARAAGKTAPRPLQVFAEGDSWFDYPVPFFGGGVIPRLEQMLGVPILNLAKAGDEVRYMLGVEERKLLKDQFKRGCPAGGPWDVMLFSGGGNDIVDNPMALWIREYDPSLSPAELIHQPRLDAAMTLVRAGYEDLIALRDKLSPDTHLIFHGYDFAIPDGRGICHMGPWLKPAFALRHFPEKRQAAYDVTKELLQQFAAMLKSLEAAHPRITVIPTQGTLRRHTSSWHNELHPSKAGYTTFAELFRVKLKELFPTRVP